MVGSLGLSACTAPVEEEQVDAVEAAPTPAPEPYWRKSGVTHSLTNDSDMTIEFVELEYL